MQDHEYKTFSELSRDEKLALFAAWIDGKEMEWMNPVNSEWHTAKNPMWYGGYKYRIALEPPPTKPSIDWSHVAPKWKFMAQDRDGCACLYDEHPEKGAVKWFCGKEGGYHHALGFASFTPGTCDWRESLVERPEGA